MNYAERKLRNARAHVVQAHAFFGALLLRQKVVEDPRVETIATDGKNLYFNAKWVEAQDERELQGVVAHEALHPGLCHHTRRGDRDPGLWNEACDYAINPVLLASGFTLPDGALVRDDLTAIGQAEPIYAKLLDERRQFPNGNSTRPDAAGGESGGGADGEQGDGDDVSESPTLGHGDFGGCGCVMDAPAETEADLRAVEAEWKVALTQAAMTAGTLPGQLERLIRDTVTPRVDWRAVLRRFMTQCARADYSWQAPNRRFVAQGMYLPALRSETVGRMLLVTDASGSMPQESFDAAASEYSSIASDVRPSGIDVAVHDDGIRAVHSFEAGDEIVVAVRAGGGTTFAPVCDFINDADEPYACVVWMTDFGASDWSAAAARAPDVPVLWLDWTGESFEPPFGEVVRMPR